MRKLAVTFIAAIIMLGATVAGEARERRILVGVAAGGSIDAIGRVLANRLSDTLGEPVIVENKTGAMQRVALTELKRSAPDGRTLHLATNTLFTMLPTIYGDRVGFDPNDFTPIARLAKFEHAIAIGPKVNGSSWADYLTWVKANPTQASYGTSGAGGMSHFLGLLIGDKTGMSLAHVPYRGGAPAISDLLGGHVSLVATAAQDLLEHHRAGKLRIIAVASSTRLQTLPEVPTLQELGINVEVDSSVSLDIYGPPGMAPDLVRGLSMQIKEAMNSAEVSSRLSSYGILPAFSTPEELATLTAAERKSWEGPIKASGYKGD
jgi:tripartite-type tricarboxylate transporter receptor subunit TctC